MALPHIGSWGLPDFGITEAIGGVLNKNNNYQGGSNLFGPQPVNPAYSSPTPTYATPKASGQVLGKNNQVIYSPQPTSNQPTYSQPTTTNNDPNSPENILARQQQQERDSISSGWDSYLSDLDQQMYGLTPQMQSQEGLVNSQYSQGINELDTYRNLGEQDLQKYEGDIKTNQTKNLRDLSANIANLMRSGSQYLGARGAGDSSAANQYSYALTKLGTQQRSDINQQSAGFLSDVNMQRARAGEIYTLEKGRLASEKDQKLQQISEWFATSMNSLRSAKANGQLQKSQDLAAISRDYLNLALSSLKQVNTDYATRNSLLDNWKTSTTSRIASAGQNINQISNPSYNLPQAQAINPFGNQAKFTTSKQYGGGVFGDDDELFA